MNYKEEIEKALKKELGFNARLEVPPNPEMGDFAFPCFSLAPKYKKNPIEIAKSLEGKVQIKFVEDRAVGPYLNFFIDKSTRAKNVLIEVFKNEDYGKGKNKNKSIVIDYSAPNVAKHMGIHNLRSTVIGQAIYNLMNYSGYKTIGINHLGDWGKNFGQLIVGIKEFSSLDKINDVKDLNKIYVKFNQKVEKNPELDEKAREAFKKLEEGNTEAIRYWKKFVKISLKDYNKIYKRLNINFDSVKGESEYAPLIKSTIDKLKKAKLTKMSDGAMVIDVGKDMPPCLLKKSDGSTLYGTRDIAAGLYRLKEYKPNKILYVVDIAQSLHFKQWFKVMEKLNKKNKEIFIHVIFGRLSFKDGAMSTRKGKVVVLEEVLDKAVEKVEKIIKKKNPKLKNKKKAAEKIGVGAVIFNDLFNDRIHNITFDWDKILDFEGDTGPYVQYSYVRASSILRKYKEKVSDDVEFGLLNEDSEVALIKMLKDFPDMISQSAESYKPSILVKYLVKLAQNFNAFYRLNPVVTEDQKMTKARILLIYCTRKTLKKGLSLLGIETLEEM